MYIVKPYNDELLSSWLFRISKANYTRLSNITKKFFGIRNMHQIDFDLYDFSKINLENFYTITQINNIEKYQLTKYISYIEESINTFGRKRWITPFNQILTTGNKFFSIRFCPECLKKYAYLKQEWRLMIVNICEEHKCFLHNYCPKCGKGLKYPNLQYEQKIITCYNCGFNLIDSEIINIKANSLHLKNQKKLLKILEYGYYKLNQRYYYSIGLFYLLRIIIKNIMKSKKIKVDYLETLEPKILSYLLTYAISLLKNFPIRLNKFYKKNGFSNMNRILDKYRYKTQCIPSWYLSNIQYNTISTRWYF